MPECKVKQLWSAERADNFYQPEGALETPDTYDPGAVQPVGSGRIGRRRVKVEKIVF